MQMASPALLLDDEAEGLEAALSLLDEYDELSVLYSSSGVASISSHGAAMTAHAAAARDDAAYDLHAAFTDGDQFQHQQYHRALSSISSRSSTASSDSGGGGGGGASPYYDPSTPDSAHNTTGSSGGGGSNTTGLTGEELQQQQQQQQQETRKKAAAGGTKSRKRPIGFNSNHARDERRKELIYLRQKVEELETQLGQLQRPNAEVSGANLRLLPPSQQNALQQLSINTWSQHGLTRAPVPGDSASALSKESSVWKELATRQHAEREKAEMENIRLKLILEEQIKIAKNLHTMLTKKTTAKLVESFGLGSSASRSQAAVPSGDDKSIFEDLLHTAEQCYGEIDSVFASNGLGGMETSYRDAQIKYDDVNGTFMEIIANKVMPFDMQATATAVWQHMTHSMQNIPLRFYYEKHPQKMENTDDTVLERIGAELYVNGKKADFQVKQIIRRYVEEDRVILIWGAYIEALEFCEEPTSGIRFREKGYLMIKRPSSMSSEFTLLQTCYIITPELGEDVPANDSKVGALTEFVLNSTAWNITASHQMIENVLLDQSFRSKRPCV